MPAFCFWGTLNPMGSRLFIKHNVSRQYVYRWKNRYDGTLQSLADQSHRPHSHPNQHTEDELKLIRDMRRRNPHAGLVVFWVKLRQRGYTRSVTSLYRILRKLGEPRKTLPTQNTSLNLMKRCAIPSTKFKSTLNMFLLLRLKMRVSFVYCSPG